MNDKPLQVVLLDRERFEELRKDFSVYFGDIPTPAINIISGDPPEIDLVAINEEFSPEDSADEYNYLLLVHELTEAEYCINHMDVVISNREKSSRGEPIDPTPHKMALVQELKTANDLGVLDEYQSHWEGWLNKSMEDVDEKTREAIQERLKWRQEAYDAVRAELDQEINSEIKNI